MKENYEACLAVTLKLEGGDVNHPDDPGGKTRWGITQATYDAWRASQRLAKRTVFQMTRDEMLAIYKANYWDAVNGDSLAAGVDLATWDYGVNSGPARARKVLLASVGGTSTQTIQKICKERLTFVRGLKTWATFGKGWSSRIATVEAKAVAMTLAPLPAPSRDSALRAEADKALGKSVSQSGKAKGSAGASIGSGAAATTDVDQWVALGLLGLIVIGVGIALYFHRKAKHNKDRAEAYVEAAQEIK